MLFTLKKIISALILPPSSLVILAFVGLWLSQNRPKTGKNLVAASLICLLTLSLPITGNALLQSLESTPPINNAQLHNIQAIVILGGGKNNNPPEYERQDTVSRWALERIRYGAYLQTRTGKPILVTGGAPFGGRSEADAMAEALQRDFHAKDVWIESRSKDTAENAAYSASIMKEHGVNRVAVISQAWHLPRAIKLFEQQGMTVYPAPTGYTDEDNESVNRWLPSASALYKSAIGIKEYLGRLANEIQ